MSESQAVKHLMKYASKDSKNNYYYPFASHPRFKFWCYDRIRRHRSLEQSKVYLKQNPGDANLNISELKAAISNGDSSQLMKRMCAYSSNITGSDSYWHKRRCELEANFEQEAPATIFFTFSQADNHWNDLHRLMTQYFNPETGLSHELNNNLKYRDVVNNPHLVDWYFSYRLNIFLETVFDKILEWRWHRFEWQSRTSIHAHGCARFKNDPGLIELTKKVYSSYLFIKNSIGKVFPDLEEIPKLELIVSEGQ